MARYSGAKPNLANPFGNQGSGSGSGMGMVSVGSGGGGGANKNAQFKEEQQAKIQRRRQEELNETQSPRGYAFTINGQIVGENRYINTQRGFGARASSGAGSGINTPPLNIQGIPNPSIENGPKPIPNPEISLPPDVLRTGFETSERPADPSEVASLTPISIANLTKEVFDKSSFNETLDIAFSQLGPENQLDPSFFDVSLATLEDFWTLYDNFFYDIPKTGPNSHETLAQRSGEYANYELIQEQIQALLDEIAEIREENVELRIENINLTVSGSIAEAEAASLREPPQLRASTQT
jgi:hypothetical protein|tara:strand:- start:1854 stop:2741 length:888 start_codon:yes stop_codon:yes gene_type:complete